MFTLSTWTKVRGCEFCDGRSRPGSASTLLAAALRMSELLGNLIGGIAFRLEGMKDIYERLITQAGVASLMVTFRYDSDGTTPLTTPAKNTPGALEIVWSDSLGDAVSDSPQDIEEKIGRILAKALPKGKLRREFLRAWRQGAPCVRRDAISFEQKTVHNAEPIMVDAVHRSDAF